MRRLVTAPLIVLALALSACSDKGDDTAAPSDFVDRDNDGYPETVDCNDEDPSVHPNWFEWDITTRSEVPIAPEDQPEMELCDEIDNDCDGEIDENPIDAPTWFQDADGDGYGNNDVPMESCGQPTGYVTTRTDCNDDTAAAFPAATEYCDGIDNDCDNNIDEGTAYDATNWYADEDEDTYGTPFDTQTACEQPEGYVEDYTDCNDQEAGINPGADEICDPDDVDEDCDGYSDDDDSSVVGLYTWYEDADGDGWGNDSVTLLLCNQPSGYVDIGEDCDDEAATVNPDNAEICGNSIDDDCDESIDESDAPHLLTWWRDQDSDGYGGTTTSKESCTKPSGYVDNDDDCNDRNATIYPGATETWYDGTDGDCDEWSDYDADYDGYESDEYDGEDCDDSDEHSYPGHPEVCDDGADNNCDGQDEPCIIDAVVYGEEANDRAGASISTAGDVDKDGNADIIIGASLHNDAGSGRGAAYVVYGSISGDVELGDAEAKIVGIQDRERLGSAVSGGGDVNKDGYDDVVIGAFGLDDGGAYAGGGYLALGPLAGDYESADLDLQLIGEVPADLAGSSVFMVGNIDGSGGDDYAIGAYRQDPGGAGAAGAVYLMTSLNSGTLDLSFADTKLDGATAGDQAGFSLGGGDFNDDGYADVLIGAPYGVYASNYVGLTHLVFGPVAEGESSLSESDYAWYGELTGDRSGWSVALIQDTNDDGYNDVLIGAPDDDTGGPSAGAAYLVLGSSGSGGTYNLSKADTKFIGEGLDDQSGYAVSSAGDINADGYGDLLVGARNDDYTDSSAGSAYIMVGPFDDGIIELASCSGKVVGMAAGDNAGQSVAPAGDTDNDGFDDMLIGAPKDDTVDTNAGAAMLILGNGDY